MQAFWVWEVLVLKSLSFVLKVSDDHRNIMVYRFAICIFILKEKLEERNFVASLEIGLQMNLAWLEKVSSEWLDVSFVFLISVAENKLVGELVDT